MSSKQGLAGKRKYITIMISKKLEIIDRNESGRASVLFASYNFRSTVYDAKKQKDHLVSFMASSESVMGPFQAIHIETT
jgi:hypothetical protein